MFTRLSEWMCKWFPERKEKLVHILKPQIFDSENKISIFWMPAPPPLRPAILLPNLKDLSTPLRKNIKLKSTSYKFFPNGKMDTAF